MTKLASTLLLCAVSSVAAFGQGLVIPQVADGGGWQTTFVITNTTTSAASPKLTCYQDVGGGVTQPWNLPFVEAVSAQNLTLSGAGTLFLHTTGNPPNATAVGWCLFEAPAGVNAYAIFTSKGSGRSNQDGTAPATASATRILVPFDNTSSFVTSMAIVNPAEASESVSVTVQNETGVISHEAPFTLPALGHMAFALPDQFKDIQNHRGVAEFYVSSGTISIIALRFNGQGIEFTTSPVYNQAGPPVIGTTGVAPAPFVSLQAAVNYQPSQTAAFPTTITLTPNADGTFTASLLGGASFTGGTSANGTTYTFSTVQSGGYFLVSSTNTLVSLSSGSLTLTINQTASGTGYAQGTASGSLTLSGTTAGSNTPLTLSGAFSGTYVATLAVQ